MRVEKMKSMGVVERFRKGRAREVEVRKFWDKLDGP